MTTPVSSVRVKSIHVRGLFGMYDHDIILNEEKMTVVHGPNGVGKTVLFKLVRDLLAGTGVELLRYPFKELRVEFNNEITVVAMRDDKHHGINVYSGIGKEVRFTEDSFNKIAHRLERKLPIHQVGPNLWIDPKTDEKLNAYDVVSRYGNRGDEDLDGLFEYGLDKWRKDQDFLPRVHIVEAQRLIKLTNQVVRRFVGSESRFIESSESRTVKDTVTNYSLQLKQKINDTLSKYGKQAQKLDQTFPQRLLQGVIKFEAMQIEKSLNDIEEIQAKYSKLGLIENKILPFKGVVQLESNPMQVATMGIYIADMEEKLSVLKYIAERIDLLLNQVNQKFTNKELFINKKYELAIKTSHGDEISVSELSSGEQHQIVLAYDMLFRIEPNSLVMIDEPELSLHVNWQERFLSDLESVIKVANFDALIATHSPYIINGRNELVVSLSAKDKYQ